MHSHITPFGSFLLPPSSSVLFPTPPPCPSGHTVLSFCRSGTCENSHGRWLLHGRAYRTHIHTQTHRIYRWRADDCIAVACIRLVQAGARVEFRLVQAVGTYMHITTSRARPDDRARADAMHRVS